MKFLESICLHKASFPGFYQALSIPDYERIFFEEAELDAEGNARFSGYEEQSFALAEIAEHQRKYIKVEKSS